MRALGRGAHLALLLLAASGVGAWGDDAAERSALKLQPRDRLLVLAPHPDDETLACGGLLQQATAARIPVRVVFLTYGDNNQWSFTVYRKHPVLLPRAVRRMGLVRHDEAVAADRILGLDPSQLTFLGYPDFGTLGIWTAHWGHRAPFRTMLTRTTAVPYRNALRPGAPYKGEEILRDLDAVIRDFRPTKIFVSHPADHNPDHRALYLFARVALWDLEHELRPALLPFLVHFGRWPQRRGLHQAEPLDPPSALATQVAWSVLHLKAAERARKRAALEAHVTQFRYSADYLLSFVRTTELFGDFPTLHLRVDAPRPDRSPSPARAAVAREPPEELTDAERAGFVGLAWRFVRREGDDLVLSTELSRPLAKAVGASFYLFGYRGDRPFGSMPKLRVEVGMIAHGVFDQDRRLPGKSVEVTRAPHELAVRVSLAALGRPERVLVSARTYLAEVPLDWTAWRVVELDAGG